MKDNLFLDTYKKLHDAGYDGVCSVEGLLEKIPDHLEEPLLDFEFTYRLVVEKRVLNQWDVMYMNSKRDISIIQGFGPGFYGVGHNFLYTLADMWIWCKQNNYISNIAELKIICSSS